MKHLKISIVLLAILSVGSFAGANPPSQAGSADSQKKDQAKTKPKGKASSWTGCVDEQDGRYVLVDDRTLTPIANLEAAGFPTEGFAKHLGHKVTVRGTSTSDGGRPTFKVRAIENISDTCAPQQQ